jgi:hypothetical protein
MPDAISFTPQTRRVPCCCRITVPSKIVPHAGRIAHVAVKLSTVAEPRTNIGDPAGQASGRIGRTEKGYRYCGA